MKDSMLLTILNYMLCVC